MHTQLHKQAHYLGGHLNGHIDGQTAGLPSSTLAPLQRVLQAVARLVSNLGHVTTYWQPWTNYTGFQSVNESNTSYMFDSWQRPDWTRARVNVKVPRGHGRRSLRDHAPLVAQRWFCRPVNPAETRGPRLLPLLPLDAVGRCGLVGSTLAFGS